MRLVPTSSPSAEWFPLSLCRMTFLFGARSFERRNDFLVSFPENGPVLREGQALRGGLGTELILGDSQALPQADSGSVYEHGIVIEAKGVDTGGRRCVVVGEADFQEREIARPICVIAHQHVVRIHGDLRMRYAVGFLNVVLRPQHFR